MDGLVHRLADRILRPLIKGSMDLFIDLLADW